MYDVQLDVGLGESYQRLSISSLVAFTDDMAEIAIGNNTRILKYIMEKALAAVYQVDRCQWVKAIRSENGVGDTQ